MGQEERDWGSRVPGSQVFRVKKGTGRAGCPSVVFPDDGVDSDL